MSDHPTARDLSVDLAEALTLGITPSSTPAIQEGDRFGRFLVRGVLGVGGMGVVFEAQDPTLDRPVAIKVMAADPDELASSPGETRMVREAKAMAKLTHPNVVRVYEVGSNRTGLYMVMELVDGATLARWLEEPRPWREVLERFHAAGRGLAAAHAAGLVHRDFKPANVLLGRDGRVLVSDFGLVSVGAGAVARAEPDGEREPAAPDVSAGVLMGTPRYMAPEQHERGAVDARADQWAFCVSLWEALFGAHPFAADTLAVMVMRVCTDDVPVPPADRGVPPHVREALRRGLARDPAARFPSMDALLDELARDPARVRRRLLLAGGGVATVLAAAALGWSSGAPTERGREPCRDLLPPAWSAAARADTLAAFRRVRPVAAEETFGRVTTSLDAYAGHWRTIRDGVCRGDDRSSSSFLDSMSCLARARGAVAALVVVFSEGVDGGVVDSAVGAVAALPSLSTCESRAPSTPGSGSARAGDAARTLIQRSDALFQTGRIQESVEAAERAVEAATGSPALEAAALLALAAAQERVDDSAAPLATYARAARSAAVGGDDELLARIWLGQMWAMSRRDQARDALTIAPLIEVAIARVGDSERLRADLAFRRGSALVELGKYDEAEPILIQALAAQEGASGPDHPESLRVRRTLANLAGYRGDIARSVELLRQVRAGMVRLYGENHPMVASLDASLGGLLVDTGEAAAAVPLCERAVAVLSTADSTHARGAYRTLAVALLRAGRVVEAGPAFAKVVEVHRDLLHRHPWVNLARAEYAMATGHPEEALALAEGAEKILRDHADRWQAVAMMVLARQALGQPSGDVSVLEAWSGKALGRPPDRGFAHLALARALAAQPARRADARRFATLAVEDFTTANLPTWRAQAEAARGR